MQDKIWRWRFEDEDLKMKILKMKIFEDEDIKIKKEKRTNTVKDSRSSTTRFVENEGWRTEDQVKEWEWFNC